MTLIKFGMDKEYLISKFGKLSDDELLRMEEQTKWDIAHLKRQIFEIRCEKERRVKGFFNHDK